MSAFVRFAALCGVLALAAGPAAAIDQPPYEKQLLRLSEILGAVQYLGNLCGGEDGSIWHDKMAALLDSEAASPERRRRLTASFNRGFRTFEETYRACTPSARFAITRYMGEGARISGDIAARYSR